MRDQNFSTSLFEGETQGPVFVLSSEDMQSSCTSSLNFLKTLTISVSPKKGASETFGTDVIFCMARCNIVLQSRTVLKVSSYS